VLARTAVNCWHTQVNGQSQSLATHQLPCLLPCHSSIQGEGVCSLPAYSTSREDGHAWPISAPSMLGFSPAHQQRQPPSRSQWRSFHSGQLLWHEQIGGEDSGLPPHAPPRGQLRSSGVDLLRQELLRHALAEVKEHGWSSAALEAAARKMSLSPSVTGILARREGELVEYFIAHCNKQLLREMQAMHEDGRLSQLGSTRARLAAALKMRLQMLEPYIDSWPQALSIAIQPSNAASSLGLLGQMVDDVWAVAGGDKSTDYNYYTKRGLLAGVYTSTELFMLTDYTPGFSDTWQALSRRLDDVVAIGKQAGSLKSAFAQLDQVVKGMRPQARPSTPPSPGSSTQAHTGESGDQNSEGAGGKQAPASGDGHP